MVASRNVSCLPFSAPRLLVSCLTFRFVLRVLLLSLRVHRRKLALREFGVFVASRECTELVQKLRERLAHLTTTPVEEQELDLLAEMHLLPPPPTAGASASNAVVHTIDAALREYPAAVLLCDRTVGGLPIVSVSAGVERLTGYEASDLLGRNCRLLHFLLYFGARFSGGGPQPLPRVRFVTGHHLAPELFVAVVSLPLWGKPTLAAPVRPALWCTATATAHWRSTASWQSAARRRACSRS